MKSPSSEIDQIQDDLELLERRLREGSGTQETAQRYHAAALACGQLDRARRLFDGLRTKHADNLQAAGHYIAICLQQGDDPAAMAAIETLAAGAAPPAGLLDAGLAVRRRLGPLEPDPTSVCLSLCMIARNEAPMLGPCLFGIKPLVDEIILVDTGSQDRTGDIARLFGAKVHAFPWCDDFAAARNFALSKASGQWILVLDADEAIAPADFSTIRGLLRSGAGGPVAFTIETRNYCHTANSLGWQANAGRYPSHEAGVGWFPSRKVRLFRRRPDIRFHFPVHERVEPSLKNGSGIEVCNVPVHHYGHLNESRNQEKARKYYTLGYAKLETMAHDAAAIRELAVQAGQLERWEEAIVLWERLLIIRPEYPEAMVNMSAAHWQLGHYVQSLEWAQCAVAKDPTLKEAYFNLALGHLLMGDFQRAESVLENSLKRQPDYLAAAFMLSITQACLTNEGRAVAIMHRLRQGAAGSALPMAIEDIYRRLMAAGHVQAGEQVKHAFSEFLK
jgi:glycosyltransferase involved in cell wall biosynthesis